MTEAATSIARQPGPRFQLSLAACENIPLREGRAVRVGEHSIAIFNLGGRFVAVDDRCPHRGGPLSDGIMAGATVVCPLHAWRVCLDSGHVEQPKDRRACVRTYPVKVEDGALVIEM